MGCRSSYKAKDGSVTAAPWVYMMTCVESVSRTLPRLVALPMKVSLVLPYLSRRVLPNTYTATPESQVSMDVPLETLARLPEGPRVSIERLLHYKQQRHDLSVSQLWTNVTNTIVHLNPVLNSRRFSFCFMRMQATFAFSSPHGQKHYAPTQGKPRFPEEE
jgi:hypothetical protein